MPAAPATNAPINFGAIAMVPSVATAINTAPAPTPIDFSKIIVTPPKTVSPITQVATAINNVGQNVVQKVQAASTYLQTTDQTNPFQTAIQLGTYLAPGAPLIAQGINTGNWQPYIDMLSKNGIQPVDFTKLKAGDPIEVAKNKANTDKIFAMVLGTVGGEGAVGEGGLEGEAASIRPTESPPLNTEELPGLGGQPLESKTVPSAAETESAAIPKEPLGTQPPESTAPRIPVTSPKSTPVNLKVNPENLNITPEAKTLLTSLAEDLAPKTAAKVGSTMTDKEVVDFAKANPNLTLDQTSRDASLKANAAMLQARQTLAAQMNALQKGTANVADKAAIIKNFFAVKTTATDLGRSLQKMSVGADATEKSTAADILSKIEKTGASVDEIIKAAEKVDFNDYNQVVTFYRQFVKPTVGDWVDLVRYNSMLSSPLTLSNISMGNAVNIATQPVVKTVAGALDYLKTGVFGGKQTHFIGEGPAYAAGVAKNIGAAVSNMTDVIKGKLDPKMLDFNIPIAAEGKTGALVKATNIFSTSHNAVYQFFNTLAKGGEEGALAVKAAHGVETPFPDMAAQAGADYATFRAGGTPEGQGDVLNGIDMVKSLVNRIANQETPADGSLASKGGSLTAKWIAKFTLPFLRISTNMAKQMVEYSPAGFSTTLGAADPITQFAKASIGTATFAGIAAMAATGNITGAAPTVPADKTAFLASGRQPYSVKIGNNWYAYNKLPPSISIPMLLASSYISSQATGQNKGKMQSVLDAFGAFGKYAADQSYVKSIGDLLSAIQGDTSKGNPMETLASNDIQQLIPFRAFAGWLAKVMDPNQRQIDTSKGAIQTQVQAFMEQLPLLRQQVPAKLDAAGNPIPNTNRVFNAFSPIQKSSTSPAQEQTFQDTQDINAMNKSNTQVAKDLNDQAAKELDNIKALPDAASKKAYLLNIAKTSPDVATKIIQLAKAPTGLTPTETKLFAASTATRAQFIAKEMQGLTKDQKMQLLQNYAQKKIVTQAVVTALAKLINP